MYSNILFLIGMRASGKTTLGRALAQRLCWNFVDTDALIQNSTGREVADIVAYEGWEGFRKREAHALRQAAQPDTVVATGGGAVLREDNRDFMRHTGLCVYLRADCAELCRRLARDPKAGQRPPLIVSATLPNDLPDNQPDGLPDNRPENLPKAPDLAREKEVRTILAEREKLYQRTAHYIVDTSLGMKALIGIVGGLALDPE